MAALALEDLCIDEEIEPAFELERVFQEQSARLHGLALVMLHNHADAEDVVQEAFIRAARNPEAALDLPAYLRMTVRNLCIDLIRRQRRGEQILSLEIAPAGIEPHSVVVARDELHSAWSKMSANDRNLVALRFAGFSYDEIATRAGMTAKCVSVALTRARKRARDLVGSAPMFVFLPHQLQVRIARIRQRIGANGVRGMEQFALASVLGAVLIAGLPSSRVGLAQGLTANPVNTGRVAAVAAGVPLTGAPTAPVPVVVPPGGGAASTSPSSTPALRPVSAGSLTGLTPQPSQVQFSEIVPSPGYASNHQVYAIGSAGGCVTVCSVLLRSDDSGVNWHTMPANGLVGNRLILLPVKAGAETLVAFSPSLGIQTSVDGALTFVGFSPGSTAFDAVANGPAGQPRMVTMDPTSTHILVYNGLSMVPTVGPAMPADYSVQDMSLGEGGRTVILTGTRGSGVDSTARSQALRCDLSSGVCSVAGDLGPASFVRLAPGAWAGSGLVLAYSPNAVLASPDAGLTWKPLSVPGTGMITKVGAYQFARRAEVVVSRTQTEGVRQSTRTFMATGSGGAFSPYGGPAFNGTDSLDAMVTLPDGHALAALGPTTGIICSADLGRVWARGC